MNQMNKTEFQKMSHALLDDSQRTRCEVWTRVMGYHRPISSFNTGKRGEFKERTFFQEAKTLLSDGLN